jgi:hypothetical protein
MIKIKKIENEDLPNIENILKKNKLDEKILVNHMDTSMVMIEDGKIIGLSIYENIKNEFGLITFIGYDLAFMDNNYRDGLYRATLNHMLYNGIEIGIILVKNDNFSFYNKLKIDKLKQSETDELKLASNYSDEVVAAFKVNIDSFFNRPCSI